MRSAFDQAQVAARDRPLGTRTADLERHDGIRIAMNHQCRQLELLQVVAEIGIGESMDAVQRSFR